MFVLLILDFGFNECSYSCLILTYIKTHFTIKCLENSFECLWHLSVHGLTLCCKIFKTIPPKNELYTNICKFIWILKIFSDTFLLWLQNWLISAGIDPVITHTKKIMYCIILQSIFYEYQNKNHKFNTSFVSLGLRPLGNNKLVLIYFSVECCI